MVDPSVPSVTPDRIPESATLLDVREDDEWSAGHAPGAVHLPMSELAARVDEVPAGPLAVICRSGGRSARVTAFLAERGHEAVNVSGGTMSWAAGGRPMTAEGAEPARVL